MNRRILIALSTGALLLGSAAGFAEEAKQNPPPMHMHKSEMDHRGDKEVATELKTEAEQLHAKAESHRKLATLYRGRSPVKGSANYAAVVEHCEQLAKDYDAAANEASGLASELSK